MVCVCVYVCMYVCMCACLIMFIYLFKGLPLPGMQIQIRGGAVDNFKRLPPDTEGEIWVSGPNVSRGYHKNPVATADAFVVCAEQGTRFLRTGKPRADDDG